MKFGGMMGNDLRTIPFHFGTNRIKGQGGGHEKVVYISCNVQIVNTVATRCLHRTVKVGTSTYDIVISVLRLKETLENILNSNILGFSMTVTFVITKLRTNVGLKNTNVNICL